MGPGPAVGCTERSQHVEPGHAVPIQELDLHMTACSHVNIMGWCSPQRASCSK